MKQWTLSIIFGMCLFSGIYAQTANMVCPLFPKPPGQETCADWCPENQEECNPEMCTVLDQPGDNADDWARNGCDEETPRCCYTPCNGTRCAVPVIEGCYNYQWQCYGAHTSLPNEFPRMNSGPTQYVDGQSTTGDFAGHVREWEYVPFIVGVEINFMIFVPYTSSTPENELRLYHNFTHTAQSTDLVKITMDIDVPTKARIGFEVKSSGLVPIKYREGKIEDGSHYTSFIGYTKIGEKYVFNRDSVNRQYLFRMCFDTRRDDTKCPFTTTPEPSSTTSMTTSTTASSTVSATTDNGCDDVTKPIGCFGQGVPRHDGTHITSGKVGGFTTIDVDGSTQLPSGTITEVQWRVWKLAPIIFQVWRPESNIPGLITGHMQLIYQTTLTPTVTEQVLELTGLDWPVNKFDRIGWSYEGDDAPPIKYNVTQNSEGGDYYALECNGCGLNHEIGDFQVFPIQRYQKQYRIRACMLQTVTVCPPTGPSATTRVTSPTTSSTTSSTTSVTTSVTTSTTKDPTCRMEFVEAACYGVPQPVGLVGIPQNGRYFYIDTQASFVAGYLTSVRYFAVNFNTFYFMLWRPNLGNGNTLTLIYSIPIIPKQLNSLSVEPVTAFEVKAGDQFGFKFEMADGEIPMRYDIVENSPIGAYRTYECSNCVIEHALQIGEQIQIPSTRVVKRFRLGPCISTMQEVCGTTAQPPIECECPAGPPGPPGPPGQNTLAVGRKRRDLNIDLIEEVEPEERRDSVFVHDSYQIGLLVWIAVLSAIVVTYPIASCVCRKQRQVAYSEMEKPRI